MNLQKIAKNIVNMNLALKNRDSVLIAAGPSSLKFAEMIAFECWKIGVQPTIQYGSDELSLKIYKNVKLKYLKNWPKLYDKTSRIIDAEIILDDENPLLAKQLPQKKIEVRRKVTKPIGDRMHQKARKKKMKIALVGFPTKGMAKALKIPYDKLNKIFWNTMDVDYNKLYRDTLNIAKKFKTKVKIIGKKTNLELSIKGRPAIIDCGLAKREKQWYFNLPAGEVFFAPVENSANGEIFFDLPCMWHYGKQVKGVWFKFKNGNVIDYKINFGEKNFEDVMKNASGEKLRIAELGIGTNPNAKPTGGMTIVDEKIKGTIHIAIGENKHFGGKNKSTIHWDFFKDMRKGRLFSNGKLIMKNGKFLDR